MLFTAVVIAATAYVFVTSAQLPDPVGSKFGDDGRVTSYMARDTYQWFMTALTLALRPTACP